MACGQEPEKSWEDQQSALSRLEQANITRFFYERGLLVARSDWSVNATQLLFQPRSVKGGHTLADHGKIALAAHGRWWTPYKSISDAAVHQAASVVFVDGQAGSALPVRVMDVYSSGGATFAVADARLSYSHAFADPIHSGHLPPAGSAPINVSMNHFLLGGGRKDDPVYDIP